MGRILKAFHSRYRSMLIQAGARQPEQGADWLVARARSLAELKRLPLSATLTQVYQNLQRQCLGRRRSEDRKLAIEKSSFRPDAFWCDSGLGGLARWLRAAGYDSAWHPRMDDGDLIAKARESGWAILTTDSGLMERRLIRDGVIPALWLPPTLSLREQLAMVFSEFGMELREPRCMACGGELARVNKESQRERIPPKTWRWIDEYYMCKRCGQLFWHGTHWRRIRDALASVARGSRAGNADIEGLRR